MNLYPTPEHQGAAEAIVEFFTTIPEIEAVCLICSCARGKASQDSCLDILALGKPEIMSTAQADIQKVWDEFYTTDPIFKSPPLSGNMHTSIWNSAMDTSYRRNTIGSVDPDDLNS